MIRVAEKMFIITVLTLCIVTTFAQLQITNITSLEVLTGALMGLGLPNATEFLTQEERQAANLAAGWTTPDGCLLACRLLRDVLNLNNSLPHDYNPESEYWAQQLQEVHPNCFVTPGTTPYVAGTVLVLEYFQCPFAVKSGGSSPYGSTIWGIAGVVIDLRTFNKLALSPDKSIATIGTGLKWGTVIDGMGILGYMVPAAYSADVGVGGYILNGGISYASSRYGLAADNVARYEVVTANGSILNATPNEHSDLYWALRGSGGQGFGIVTHFDLKTFPVPPKFFGGFYSTVLKLRPYVFEAFEDFVRNRQGGDDGAQFICAVSPLGTHSIISHLDGVANSSTFERILAVESVNHTLKEQTMSSLAREIAAVSPRGNREMFSSFTVEVNASWMQDCSEFFISTVTDLRSLVQDRMLEPGLSFDPLSPAIMEGSADAGGGPMSLDRLANGSYIVVHLGFGWLDEDDDLTVQQAAYDILSHCTDSANENQRLSAFIYPGYANANQNILSGFGEANVKRLRSIAEAYDPTGWLRKLQHNGRNDLV